MLWRVRVVGAVVVALVMSAVSAVGPSAGAASDGAQGAERVEAAALGAEAGPSVLLHDPAWLDDPSLGTTSFLDGTPDGRYLAYATTDATVMGPRGSAPGPALVVRDTVTDTIEVEWKRPVGSTTAALLGAELSADGRWMAISGRLGLDADRPDGSSDQVYLLDRFTDDATLVSRRFDGTAGSTGRAALRGIDDSGRYVVFETTGTDLAGPGAGFVHPQLYRYDRLTDAVELVSRTVGPPNGGISGPVQVSGDGDVLLFGFWGTNIDTTGPGGQAGTFVSDLDEGTIRAVASLTDQNVGMPASLAMSRDGSTVAFASNRNDLGFSVPGINDQVVLWHRATRTFTLASPAASSPTTGSNGTSEVAGISRDGSVVAFRSLATDHMSGSDTNGVHDAFVRDVTGGTTRLLSRSSSSPTTTGNGTVENLRLSEDGTFATFDWSATDAPAGPVTTSLTPVAAVEVATGASVWIRRAPVVLTSQPFYDNAWVSNGGHVGVVNATHGTILARIAPDPLVAAGRFVPLPPHRLLDTRTGDGDERILTGIALDRPEELHLQVTGRGGVPVRDVTAVVLNVTSVDAPAAGFVSVRPSRIQPQADPFCLTPVLHSCTRPAGAITTSNLNVDRPGRVIANHVTVPIGPGGRVALASTAGGHLVADVLGYYTPAHSPTAGRLVAQAPSRILDTRDGLGAPQGVLARGATVRLQVAGRGGVPASAAAAVVMNVTVAGSTSAGFLTAWPSQLARPLASNLNVEGPGQVRPNLVTVPLGADGAVDLLLSAGGHLVADVLGWYTDSSGPASTSGRFVPVDPVRFLDTRDPGNGGPAKPGAGQVVSRSPSAAGLPVDAAAVIANLTATDADGAGFVTAYPTGTALPLASNLNVEFAGQTIPNQALLRLGAGGSVSFLTSGGTHLIADSAGWWTD